MLRGRLGLAKARVPHADRHGLLWLGRGSLFVRDGCLRFETAGGSDLEAGDYAIPYQTLSCLLLQPGTTVSHDALRLLARHGTGLVVCGDGGVRLYASMPFGPGRSALARRQVALWSDGEGTRIEIARRMYAWRLGEVFPHRGLDALRGMEGARMRESYRALATQYGVRWRGRRYDRSNPNAADLPNRSLNHVATAMEAAALVAVASVGALPQLGFIHEDASTAFALDLADLYRTEVTVPLAFRAAGRARSQQREDEIERIARKMSGAAIRERGLIPKMIDRIKQLFLDDDDRGDS